LEKVFMILVMKIMISIIKIVILGWLIIVNIYMIPLKNILKIKQNKQNDFFFFFFFNYGESIYDISYENYDF